MALNERLISFYQRILKQWGKAHGLRTVCELTCRNLSESFSASHAQLIVAHKSKWKVLLHMDHTGIHYQFPPTDFSDSNNIPFFQITKAARLRQPTLLAINNGMRLLLPLERRSHTIGCLIIDFPDQPLPQEHEFSFLATLLASELDASLLGETIQDEHYSRRSAERELQISQHEQQILQEQLQALHDISFKLWRADSMDSMLYTAVDEAKKELHIDRMAIFLFKENHRMQGTYGTDIHGRTVDEHYFESDIPDQWFASHTLAQKEYLAIKDGIPLYHDLKQVGFGWNAYISLWDEDTPVGWIACDNLLSGRPLHNCHHQLLKQFGFIVSQHIVRRQAEENLIRLNKELEQRVSDRTAELERVNSKLERISRLDPLTGVSNRRVFDEKISEEWHRAERHQLPLSLLIIDVDHFKAYNDCYGHAAGDQCLKTIANTLANLEKRAGALFARYGGEEFVLLLPGQDRRAARYAAQKALYATRELRLPHSHGAESISDIVTISIGVNTIIPPAQSTPDEFFKQTDIALYEAKSMGRNRFFETSPQKKTS